jgi:hypothetical protein
MGNRKSTWSPAREERETGAFFLSLSLSVLLAAAVFAARRPLPPLPAIAAGNLSLERALGIGGALRG